MKGCQMRHSRKGQARLLSIDSGIGGCALASDTAVLMHFQMAHS